MNHYQVTIIVAVVAVLVVVGVIGFLLTRKRRTQLLRERFGPEYDRVVKKEGDVHQAEAVLQFRRNAEKSSKSNPFLQQLARISRCVGLQFNPSLLTILKAPFPKRITL